METGIIKTVYDARGFGFVKCDRTKQDVFFHASRNPEFIDLCPGDLVEFETAPGRNGRPPRATNVRMRV
jgi:cold shock CspA family protein